MRIGDVCNRNLVCAEAALPLPEVSRLMRQHHVGSVVVVDGAGKAPVGIVTDRDIVVEVVAAGLDHRTVTAGEIMEAPILTAKEDDEVADILKRMRLRGVRRMPVLDASGNLVGVASLDDLLETVAGELSEIVQAVRTGPRVENARRH
ncbi:MAG: CBS domain-containing protein [Bacillota bacterium]